MLCSETLRPAQFARLVCGMWRLNEAPAVLLALVVMVVIEVEDVIQVVMFDVVVCVGAQNMSKENCFCDWLRAS